MENKTNNMYNYETVEKLAELVHDKELSEITITDGNNSITIKGKKQVQPAGFAPFPMQPPVIAAAQESDKTDSESKPQQQISGNVVKSPIVGTFYDAPAPDKAPFVKVGDSVKKGDVIMIIESMKLMNEIQSDYDGTVKKILAKTGDAVEYDQPLMIIG
jgi:acetyl-CoA carboxylase biotin carboxyl carrier protein